MPFTKEYILYIAKQFIGLSKGEYNKRIIKYTPRIQKAIEQAIKDIDNEKESS